MPSERFYNREYLLNDLQRSSLSCARIIWLLPHSHPLPPSKLSLFLRLPECRQSSLQMGDRGRGWGKSQIIRRRESLVIHIIQFSLVHNISIVGPYFLPIAAYMLARQVQDDSTKANHIPYPLASSPDMQNSNTLEEKLSCLLTRRPVQWTSVPSVILE